MVVSLLVGVTVKAAPAPASGPKCVRTIPLGTHLQLACWLCVAIRGVWFLVLCLQALSEAARHLVPDPPSEGGTSACQLHADTGMLPSRMECRVDLQAHAPDAVGWRLWIMDKQSAQLAQQAGALSLIALLNPRPPNARGRFAHKHKNTSTTLHHASDTSLSAAPGSTTLEM